MALRGGMFDESDEFHWRTTNKFPEVIWWADYVVAEFEDVPIANQTNYCLTKLIELPKLLSIFSNVKN